MAVSPRPASPPKPFIEDSGDTDIPVRLELATDTGVVSADESFDHTLRRLRGV